MTDASHLPLTLYNANLQLWLRIGQLLEDNRGQWRDLLGRHLQDRLAEAGGEASRLQAGDWSALALLPGSALWHLAERQLDDMQALAQSAGEHQTAFAEGFQQALAEWQDTTSAALEEATAGTTGSTRPFDELRRVLDQLTEVMAPPAASPQPAASDSTRKPARRTAARTAPAREASPAAKAPAGATKKAAKRTAKRAATRAPAKKAAAPAKTAARKTPPSKAPTAKSPARKAPPRRAAKKAPARKAVRKSGGNGAAG